MDPRNFNLTTDAPLDKIIYLATGNFTVNAMDSASSSLPHGLNFAPLLDGTWSTDPLFSTVSYDMGSGPPSTVSGFLFNIAPDISASSTNRIIEASNITGSPITIYYRVFGFMPSDVDLSVLHTSNLADDYSLSTDFNNTKLFEANIVTLSTVVNHNLGYLPQISLWEESGGIIRKKNLNNIPEASLAMFDDQIRVKEGVNTMTVIYGPFAPSNKIHYRIYYDE